MASKTESNWRAAPAFYTVYDSIADCVAVAISEFSRRRRTQFVILRHQINNTWHLMPFSEYRSALPSHPCHPSTICYFGNYAEFQEICLSFPPDLFNLASDTDLDEPVAQTEEEIAAACSKTLKALDDADKANRDGSDPKTLNPENS